jgi:hypothetical protein
VTFASLASGPDARSSWARRHDPGRGRGSAESRKRAASSSTATCNRVSRAAR